MLTKSAVRLFAVMVVTLPVSLLTSPLAVAPLRAQVDTTMKGKMKMDSMKSMKMGDKMDMKDMKMGDKMGSMDMKKMMEGEHASSGWKELDAFHMLMMAAWHPVMEKGDLAPARANAPQLSASAKAWSNSKAPAACNTPELKAALGDVVRGSKSLADLVATSAGDSAVKSELTQLHKRFAVLEMGCKPAKP